MRTAQAVQSLAGKRERKVSLWVLWCKEDNSKWNVTARMLCVDQIDFAQCKPAVATVAKTVMNFFSYDKTNEMR